MSTETQIQCELDGEFLTFEKTLSFGEVSDQIKQELAPQRVLTEIFVDGEVVDLDEEEKMLGQSISKLGSLSFRSKEVGSLFQESLKLAPSICEALILDVDDIDQFFDKGEELKANERVAELSALVDWLLQMISGLQLYGSDDSFQKIAVEAGTSVDSVKRMETLLKEMHSSLEAQQYDQFRATLTGGFKEELKVWKDVFTKASSCWTPRSLGLES